MQNRRNLGTGSSIQPNYDKISKHTATPNLELMAGVLVLCPRSGFKSTGPTAPNWAKHLRELHAKVTYSNLVRYTQHHIAINILDFFSLKKHVFPKSFHISPAHGLICSPPSLCPVLPPPPAHLEPPSALLSPHKNNLPGVVHGLAQFPMQAQNLLGWCRRPLQHVCDSNGLA